MVVYPLKDDAPLIAYSNTGSCPCRRAAPDLRCGYRYFDAQTDDVRLVLRVIRTALRAGGLALNYAPVTSLLRTRDKRVCGVVVRDEARRGNAMAAWARCLMIGRPRPWPNVIELIGP